ncbi:TKL/LISK/LISK-DD1 protein kinase [Coprinopsis cinerea okayama7|uniref:TKL/LISK/LISK-DD1 protein kinase n=1 Tax=Coprinopsis cinerea (strain Okayama-7 / 130 / ATCC MYA-4618 / FGSC 9003) TaxID=240176 RepID=A8NJH7_COPC7|nr:TKL/LISK/LISK-DD1 protein kinase [Coprinopsis cinerea okayama7\|eukprot:XP_001834229.1 TKL/LISK/LISK-DD1 protein kinase [Coprinopsis cinerea okayama7\
MHSDAFDVIPYEDIKGDWKKLGSGSFGNVYKGSYLGIDVAIKEVLPSNDYDVAKYFEREWRLMKECRHPNICLFIGLSRAPPPDNRIFIVSEFIEGGNVRLYIHDKNKPFPWRLRMSFATDVARALAYLHARKCIHRDLKGENLLVTSNGRIKVTDFGFARIAARNEEELRRLTFCGTDSYMSPEILLGDEFDLPTDVFSLGIIFCEIAARRLADDRHFKRHPPTFGIDPEEVRKLATPGCPEDFLKLCLDCLNTEPARRPGTREILDRLRLIEAEVLARPAEDGDVNVGSVRFISGARRPGAAPRIPSFGMGVGKDIRGGSGMSSASSASSDESDEELMEAVSRLTITKAGLEERSAWSTSSSVQPLLDNQHTPNGSTYSTSVIRQAAHSNTPSAPALSSILTIRPSPDPNRVPEHVLPATTSDISHASTASVDPLESPSIVSIATLDSYRTANTGESVISSTYATEGGSTIRSLHAPGHAVLPTVHRFTLLKPGTKPKKVSLGGGPGGIGGAGGTAGVVTQSSVETSVWNPLEIFFSSGLLISKCDLCAKRIGWKPFLECDDCGLRTHVKCGDLAPRDCGMRAVMNGHQHSTPVEMKKISQSDSK